MDLETLEPFSFAHPLWFEHPRLAQDAADDISADVPSTWRSSASGPWVHHHPPLASIPETGWKLHIAALPSTLRAVVSIVSRLCVPSGTPFKHLATERLALIMNGKYAHRASSGKCVTIYPADESTMLTLASELDRALHAHRDAPRLLTDHRWNSGPVFARHGAFRRHLCLDATGHEVEAMTAPDGSLVPDVRELRPTEPAWSPLPADFLFCPDIDEVDSPLDEFDDISAMHFSNGGGVYRAVRRRDGAEVVIKEGRPHAGLDGEADAATRVRHEASVLEDLAGIAGVAALIDAFDIGDHAFLVREHAPGMTLTRWVSSRHPFVGAHADAKQADGHLEAVLRVDKSLRALLDIIHVRGHAYRDLHPHNVLIDGDDVTLIDFELAAPVEVAGRAPLGAAPFRGPQDARGAAIDDHALDALLTWMLVPYVGAAKWGTHIVSGIAQRARDWFTLPRSAEGAVTRWARSVTIAPGTSTSPHEAHLTGPAADVRGASARAWRGIDAAMTRGRDDRLHPGHPSGNAAQAVSLSSGAAGIAYARQQCGLAADDGELDWITSTALALPVAPAGVRSGLDGVALVLARAGRLDDAVQLVQRTRSLRSSARTSDYADGTAGIARVLSEIATLTGDTDLRRDARRTTQAALAGADRLLSAPRRHGLLFGPSGLAMTALREYDDSGDDAMLHLAIRLVEADLDACVRTRTGSLEPATAGVHYPYLGAGAAGIALAARAIIGRCSHPRLEQALPALTRSLTSAVVIEPGWERGRCGLIAAAHTLGDTRAVNTHLAELPLHLAHVGDALVLPSIGAVKLSSDLSTGTAGFAVLLALLGGADVEIFPGMNLSTLPAATPRGRVEYSTTPWEGGAP